METVFISRLKPLMDAVAAKRDLYIPKRTGDYFVFDRYDPSEKSRVEINDIRACTPAKEFLFPPREIAARYPQPAQPPEIRPFAVFGLKDCDLRSIAILDKVFAAEDFADSVYIERREKMFIIASDCTEPGESCFCCLFGGMPYSQAGFDLNISPIKDGFIVESGSKKGHGFLEEHSQLFADVPHVLLDERDAKRKAAEQKLRQRNSTFNWGADIGDAVNTSQDAEIYDEQADKCIECQACTRVCPTCHCFLLYDGKQSDYFTKMKIWDSCMRFSYAAVAGGENPNKVLGDRMKHRLMHKFVHFVERYGVHMCVGCGRCVDADAGGMDLRQILNSLSEQSKNKGAGKI